MVLNFDNIDVAINYSGILAQNASISSNNSINSSYTLGGIGAINQLPFGPIQNNFNFSYFPIINQEPNYTIVNKIKNMTDDSSYIGEKVEIAGITHDYCFLESYSLKLQPNGPAQAQASYITFWDLCGDLRPKSNRINYLNDNSLIHSWSTFVTDSLGNNNQKIYELDYSFKANWKPIYIIGKKTPIEVKLLNASETLSFHKDTYTAILFTGENIYPNIITGSHSNIRFKDISLICENNCEVTGNDYGTLSINLSGFKIQNIEVTSTVGQYLRVNYLANKFY